MLASLALAVALVAAPAPPAVYDFQWRSDAQVSRLEGSQVRTVRDAIEGHGRLVLSSVDDVLAFEWSGDGGSGRGVVGPTGVESVTFPTPESVGIPPAPPHPLGGVFRFEGRREQPKRFEITYGEAFICRTDPAGCDRITSWERRFTGLGTRLTRETRHRARSRMASVALQTLIALCGGAVWSSRPERRRSSRAAPAAGRRA